jgi:hypothetical protein
LKPAEINQMKFQPEAIAAGMADILIRINSNLNAGRETNCSGHFRQRLFSKNDKKNKRTAGQQSFCLEVPSRFELLWKLLQSSA